MPNAVKVDGKCICPHIPVVLRQCSYNGTCGLKVGDTCRTAEGAYWGGRLGSYAAPLAVMISTAPVGGGYVAREKTPRRDIRDDETRIRAAFKALAKSEEVAKPSGREQGFAIVAVRVLQGYRAAKAIAEVPAEPLQESKPTMKFSGLGPRKAGWKKKGAFATRHQWIKAKRRKDTRTQGCWVFAA